MSKEVELNQYYSGKYYSGRGRLETTGELKKEIADMMKEAVADWIKRRLANDEIKRVEKSNDQI